MKENIDLKEFHIIFKKDVETFFNFVYNELKIILHPDDDFNDIPSLSQEEKTELNRIMEECFDLVGEDIYVIAFNCLIFNR